MKRIVEMVAETITTKIPKIPKEIKTEISSTSVRPNASAFEKRGASREEQYFHEIDKENIKRLSKRLFETKKKYENGNNN